MKREAYEPLGIPSNGSEYLKLNESQDLVQEFFGICDFLGEVISSNQIPEFQNPNKRLQFINYGDTQLVYVVTVGEQKYTILLGQPATEFGTVKREHDNLKALKARNPKEVVAPFAYFADEEQKRELYITPYLYQARCIASQEDGWGVYIPEPDYRFELFSEKQRSIVNSAMIASLVKFYDEKNKLGIASCKIGGGDFVLEKELDEEEFSEENVLKRMKLIAARDLIEIDFDTYLATLRREFSQSTYYKSESQRDKSVLVNHKSRIPMTEAEIERGIELGLILKEKQKTQGAR